MWVVRGGPILPAKLDPPGLILLVGWGPGSLMKGGTPFTMTDDPQVFLGVVHKQWTPALYFGFVSM